MAVTVIFLSTPSARRATFIRWALSRRSFYFYPRPLRGGRQVHVVGRIGIQQFLSTPSARRATGSECHLVPSSKFLSTPSARRATQNQGVKKSGSPISIHALCEEGDTLSGAQPEAGWTFLSTPSARRATNYLAGPIGDFLISIHALCEEGDAWPKRNAVRCHNFYPRPLRGGRPIPAGCSPLPQRISIHALCEEGDAERVVVPDRLKDFYPRPLRGGRLSPCGARPTVQNFYPRPLRGGRLQAQQEADHE